jgi:hypothetical protein
VPVSSGGHYRPQRGPARADAPTRKARTSARPVSRWGSARVGQWAGESALDRDIASLNRDWDALIELACGSARAVACTDVLGLGREQTDALWSDLRAWRTWRDEWRGRGITYQGAAVRTQFDQWRAELVEWRRRIAAHTRSPVPLPEPTTRDQTDSEELAESAGEVVRTAAAPFGFGAGVAVVVAVGAGLAFLATRAKR